MSATYVFGSRSANSARRVADSKRMGRTPVASGSSVPAWPTRWAPVRRRRRLTTAKEVSPAALSTLSTPAGNRGRSRRSVRASAGWMRTIRSLPLALRSSCIYATRSGAVLVAPTARLAPGRICSGRPAGPTSSVVGRGGKDRLLGGSKHHLHRLVHRPLDLGAGGANMPATSERCAQRSGIHRTAAAHADLGQRVVHFFEEDGQLQALS